MVNEIIHHFKEKRNGVFLDCTIGNGGHTLKLLETLNGQCSIVGLDQDAEALTRATDNLKLFQDRVVLRHINFTSLDTVLDELHITHIDACLFDIGVSMNQLYDAQRGFSFSGEGPLDMRMDARSETTAATIVNTYREEELNRILREYGEEYRARQIVRAIIKARAQNVISTTTELAELVKKVYRDKRHRRTHPATKTFQALRIAVNNELDNLKNALNKVVHYVTGDGLICVITFHSLEDRIVKQTFRAWADEGIVSLLTKKPLQPSQEEMVRNPRARSAKMRIAKRSLHR
ncbi:MAG: 16S rRNA (cytosine(1402)-N(4))-methyltransferase RsmH [Candidatus Omnitrophica bacterium]|nr:16S rRNA (cytosine(1402)-N(4))-methyltransferase RsmH [Candidatus Omnitrophota bacterium]